MVYPHKWSPISYKSSAEQRKHVAKDRCSTAGPRNQPVLRYQNDLADLVCEDVEEVPLLSHVNSALFMTAAFDNFDHDEANMSGLGSSHDTVSVLFQNKYDNIPRKPLISETDVVDGRKSFQKELKCQALIDFIKPARKGDIASDYQVCHEMPGHVSTEQKDVAWSLARMDLSKVVGNVNSHVCENQKMPLGVRLM